MKIVTTEEVPLAGTLQVYKQSPLSAFVGLVVVWGIVGVLAVAILRGAAPPFLWFVVGFIALISLLFLGMLRAAMGPDNWVLKSDGSQLAFKFRSYLNRHFPKEDRVVAVVPVSAIAGIGKVTERKLVPQSKGGPQRETWVSIDFRLKSADQAAELAAAIREELRRPAPKIGMSRTKHHHAPVRVVDGTTIRVSWRSPQDFLSPGVTAALRNLGAGLPIEAEQKADVRDYRDMTPEELNAYLIELAETGQSLKAGRILREVNGVGLTESRAYIDALLQAPDAAERE